MNRPPEPGGRAKSLTLVGTLHHEPVDVGVLVGVTISVGVVGMCAGFTIALGWWLTSIVSILALIGVVLVHIQIERGFWDRYHEAGLRAGVQTAARVTTCDHQWSRWRDEKSEDHGWKCSRCDTEAY